MPKKHDQKKIKTHEGPSVEKNGTHEGPRKNIYIYIAMSSCYPNKRERDP
jgi:hypothetical protein